MLLILGAASCQGQEKPANPVVETPKPDETIAVPAPDPSPVEAYYAAHKGDEQPSKSLGTVSNGSLENGKLLPFSGDNFQYFDTTSYLGGRAFLNDKVRNTVRGAYEALAGQLPGRQFCYMECANEKGGKIFPHRTHQNGLSVDFMMPLIQEGAPYYELDQTGKTHYLLDFDNEGKYTENPAVSVDFDLVARHILLLESEARKQKLKITKVIIKTELKDELYASPNGKKLKSSGIYVVRNLTPLINSLHDDHYHIDFGPL